MEDTEYRNQRDLNQEIHCVSIRKTEEPAGNSEAPQRWMAGEAADPPGLQGQRQC